MKTQKIKSQIKKLSEEFNLRYNPAEYGFMWISKRHARYLEYVGMSHDPIYTRFGKTVEKKIENIEKFERSKEFKKIKNEYGGQAITKKEILKGIKDCKKIRKPKLRRELLNLHNNLLLNLKEDNLALLTKTNNKNEKKILLNSFLLHEWIHLLLMKNKIYFKSISEKYWKYDEGLVTYLEYYLQNRLNYLEFIRNKTKYPHQKKYYIYAIKFREFLKTKKTPRERKKAILRLIKELSPSRP